MYYKKENREKIMETEIKKRKLQDISLACFEIYKLMPILEMTQNPKPHNMKNTTLQEKDQNSKNLFNKLFTSVLLLPEPNAPG